MYGEGRGDDGIDSDFEEDDGWYTYDAPNPLSGPEAVDRMDAAEYYAADSSDDESVSSAEIDWDEAEEEREALIQEHLGNYGW